MPTAKSGITSPVKIYPIAVQVAQNVPTVFIEGFLIFLKILLSILERRVLRQFNDQVTKLVN